LTAYTKQFLPGLEKALATCNAIFLAAGGGLLIVIAMIGAGDVVSANLFDYPLPAANTFAEVALPPSVFLSVGYVVRTQSEIMVDILVQSMSVRWRWFMVFISAFLSVLLFGALTYGAWLLAFDSVALNEKAVAAIEFPVWPAKIGFALGATLALVEYIRILILSVTHAGRNILSGNT